MREEEEAFPSVISLIVLSKGDFKSQAPGISIQLTGFAKLV